MMVTEHLFPLSFTEFVLAANLWFQLTYDTANTAYITIIMKNKIK